MKKISIEIEVWDWMSLRGITDAMNDIGLRVLNIKDLEDIKSSENTTNKESN